VDIFGFRLPSPSEAYNWLKNWAETYIYNPILFVLKQIKDGGIWVAVEVASAALATAAFFSELKRRFLATLAEGVRLAKALTTTAINDVRLWVYGWLKVVWETLERANKALTDWALGKLRDLWAALERARKTLTDWILGKLADLWLSVNSLLKFISGINDWFVKKFNGAVDASAALIYDVLVRFIDAIW